MQTTTHEFTIFSVNLSDSSCTCSVKPCIYTIELFCIVTSGLDLACNWGLCRESLQMQMINLFLMIFCNTSLHCKLVSVRYQNTKWIAICAIWTLKVSCDFAEYVKSKKLSHKMFPQCWSCSLKSKLIKKFPKKWLTPSF